MNLETKLKERTARVAIIGLGYVGLPEAMAVAESGFHVTGIDVDAQRVASLRAGRSYVDDVANSQLRAVMDAGRFAAHTDFAPLAAADVVTICVPTPLGKTKDPDVSYIRAASAEVAQRLRRGQLIVLESTTYPGTTEEIIRPSLEETGLVAGRDFFLAFSPERIDPGNPHYNIRNTPKVVGGSTPRCARIATLFYSQFVEQVVSVSNLQTAEMVKLLENTFRLVNIALVNELAVMSDVLGVDIDEVIGAAATKPFGFMPFHPGPGLGGHCIPVDPEYLAWKLKSFDCTARFIGLAGEINARMPHVVVDKITEALNAVGKSVNRSRLLVLGVAYKRDVADTRESPALSVISLLQQRGADVSFHDPHVKSVPLNGGELASVPLTPRLLAEQDCVAILTDHSAFDVPWIVAKAKLVVDTRNATRGLTRFRHRIVKLGAPSELLRALRAKEEAA